MATESYADRKLLTLDDERLLKVDVSDPDFFTKILEFESNDKDVLLFKERLRNVQKSKLSSFWKLICFPYHREGEIIFKDIPLFWRSFNWWKAKSSEIPEVEGRKWRLGNEQEYIAYIAYLINSLVSNGLTIDKAIEVIVVNPEKLWDIEILTAFNAIKKQFHIDEIRDAGKLLACSDERNGFFLAGTVFYDHTFYCNISELTFSQNVNLAQRFYTGWLVLA